MRSAFHASTILLTARQYDLTTAAPSSLRTQAWHPQQHNSYLTNVRARTGYHQHGAGGHCKRAWTQHEQKPVAHIANMRLLREH
jgi:hypothetical protein